MDFDLKILCAPALTFMCFSIAWSIYCIFELHITSAVIALLFGAVGVASLEFLCRNLSPVVAWVLLSLPLIYITVVAGMFAYTKTIARLQSSVLPGCQGAFCMKGRAY
jgi:hypothetical protein